MILYSSFANCFMVLHNICEEERYLSFLNPNNMDSLPVEVLELILSYLSPYQEYGVAACVCSRWKHIVYAMLKQLPLQFEQNLLRGKIEWFSVVEGQQTSYLSPRIGQAVCYNDYSRSMFVFGGKSIFSSGAGFNDLLELNLHSLTWRRIIARGAIPPPKYGCSLDSYKDFLILFGGSYLPSTNTLHRGITEYSNDLHIFSIKSNQWIHKPFLAHECPKEINSPKTCMISDHDDNELDVMLLYGGNLSSINSEMNSDIWCLQLCTWVWEKQTLIGDNSAGDFHISKMTLNRLQSTAYSSAVIALGQCPSTKLPLVWLIYRTGAAEWTVQSITIFPDPPVLFSNVNFHMPTLLLGKTLMIFRSTCSDQYMPNVKNLIQSKTVYSKSSADQFSTSMQKVSHTVAQNGVATSFNSEPLSVLSKVYLFLLDLSNVESDGFVKCVQQLDSSDGKLLPSFAGLGISSNVSAVIGRGEIILQCAVKSGKRSYMSLALVRSMR